MVFLLLPLYLLQAFIPPTLLLCRLYDLYFLIVRGDASFANKKSNPSMKEDLILIFFSSIKKMVLSDSTTSGSLTELTNLLVLI